MLWSLLLLLLLDVADHFLAVFDCKQKGLSSVISNKSMWSKDRNKNSCNFLYVFNKTKCWLSPWWYCWCLKRIHWFQVHHSHQVSASASILASKFKWVLDQFKCIKVSVNTDALCQHGLSWRFIQVESCLESCHAFGSYVRMLFLFFSVITQETYQFFK